MSVKLPLFPFRLVLVAIILSAPVLADYAPRLETRFTGLDRPILIRNAHDGSQRLFIVEQTGRIKVVQPGATVPTLFLDLSSKSFVPVVTGDERGLLGMAFNPNFATNGKFYAYYIRASDGSSVIAEYRTTSGDGTGNTADVSTERILITVPQPFSNHKAGMMDFGTDGYLYISLGDGGSSNDPGNRSQNKSLLYGKMLRIDPNVPDGSQEQYLIPPTNPFTGTGTARCDTGSTTSGTTCQEIWLLGFRNPWRWSFDRSNGQMWIGDVGESAVEEIDTVTTGGGNYGWRVYEGNQCTGIDPGLCNPANFVFPIFTYSHIAGRCAITGGYVYRGTLGSLPAGAYTFADYCTGELWMLQNGQQVLLQNTHKNIVSFGEDEAGEIYVCYANGQIDKITRARASGDLDGDFKTDIAVYRPGQGVWYVINSSNDSLRIQQFGLPEDIPAPEDYDGDNVTDIGVFRPSTGTWYYFRSSDGTVGIIQFGLPGDIPAAGDYDGDKKADLTVYRPSTGTWFTQRSTDGGFSVVKFGLSQDIPTPGDFDGDGRYDIAVWRPTDGIWYRLNSSNGAFAAIQFGLNGDEPAPGDFDGDGRNDLIVFRPSTRIWYILQSSNGAFAAFQWGLSDDVPAVGDYDGDGKDDIAVFRPSTGVWYIRQTGTGALQAAQFGLSTDLPVPSYDLP